jgi:uncharacterized OB-fold protein
MSGRDTPRNGPARVLSEADPNTPFTELQQRLSTLHRWRCTQCGNEKYTDPPACSECGAETFQKLEAAEGGR